MAQKRAPASAQIAIVAVSLVAAGIVALLLARRNRDDDEVPPMTFAGPMAFGDAEQAEAHPS